MRNKYVTYIDVLHMLHGSNDVYSTSSFDWQLVDALAPESQDGRGDPSDGPRRSEHHHDPQVSHAQVSKRSHP